MTRKFPRGEILPTLFTRQQNRHVQSSVPFKLFCLRALKRVFTWSPGATIESDSDNESAVRSESGLEKTKQIKMMKPFKRFSEDHNLRKQTRSRWGKSWQAIYFCTRKKKSTSFFLLLRRAAAHLFHVKIYSHSSFFSPSISPLPLSPLGPGSLYGSDFIRMGIASQRRGHD